MRPQTDQSIAGRYRLRRPVASGGMGTVWEAHDQQLDRRVAVKIPPEHLASDEAFLTRFQREARSAARLSHAHVAQVFDYGVDDGRPYLVMEFVDGETLAERLRRGALPQEEARRIAIAMAQALQAAHGEGIVHRDVKPGNVMLTPDGGIKVLDFGIAAAEADARVTTSGVIMGTPTYLAPERAQGKTATPASDVYSLGVVLYEMLSGRPPFEGDSALAVTSAHVHGEPDPLERIVPGIDPALAKACKAAMQKDQASRPGSAGEFAALLQGEAEPVAAPPASATGADTQVLPRDRTERLPSGAVPVAAGPTTPTAPEEERPVSRRTRGWAIGVGALIAALVLALVIFVLVTNLPKNEPGPAISNQVPTVSQPPPQQSPSTKPSPSASTSSSSPNPTVPTTTPPTSPSSLPTPSLSATPG